MAVSMNDLWWITGLWAGEGTAYVQPGYGSVRLQIYSTDQRPILWLVEALGGSVYCDRRLYAQRKGKNHKPLWCWYLGGAPAAGLAMTMIPMLASRFPSKALQLIEAVRQWRYAPRKQGVGMVPKRTGRFKDLGRPHFEPQRSLFVR